MSDETDDLDDLLGFDGSDDSDRLIPDWTDSPWAIVFPGLSEERANNILRVLKENGLGNGAWIDSPADAVHLGLDRDTALWLRTALSAEAASVPDPSGHGTILLTPEEARSQLGAIVFNLDRFLELPPDERIE